MYLVWCSCPVGACLRHAYVVYYPTAPRPRCNLGVAARSCYEQIDAAEAGLMADQPRLPVERARSPNPNDLDRIPSTEWSGHVRSVALNFDHHFGG